MAIASYIVICDQESTQGKTQPVEKWVGAAAESEVTSVRAARMLTINAESTAEAIKGVKQLYPGWVKTKCIAVEKAGTEEA